MQSNVIQVIYEDMKSYTDIEQSRKLAEILPLESADMYYESAVGFCTEPSEPRFGDIKYAHPRSIRCWSLAALLSVLPYGYSSILTKSFNGKDYYCEIDGKPFECQADNPIDACVAMIEKLHELNLL